MSRHAPPGVALAGGARRSACRRESQPAAPPFWVARQHAGLCSWLGPAGLGPAGLGPNGSGGRRRVRAGLRDHYDQFLKVVGWLTTVVALLLLGVSLLMHLDYSPFRHPGAPPSPDRLDVLRLDGVRWLLTTIAGSLCGMRHAPRRRSRFEPGPGS